MTFRLWRCFLCLSELCDKYQVCNCKSTIALVFEFRQLLAVEKTLHFTEFNTRYFAHNFLVEDYTSQDRFVVNYVCTI